MAESPNDPLNPFANRSRSWLATVTADWHAVPTGAKWLVILSMIIFALATACALAGTLDSGYGWSQKWWLAAGWLMGMVLVLASAVTAARAYTIDDGRSVVPATLIMNIVTFIVSGFIVVSFWTAGSGSQWASGLIWCAACLMLGGFSGFLFGIPRFRSEGKTRLGAAGPKIDGTNAQGQQVTVTVPPHAPTSTNDQSPIEQIADWLTKTIVGVALVNLKELPGLLTRWSTYVALSMGQPGTAPCAAKAWCGEGASFALGVIIYFTLIGFLSGYLLTQVFLQSYVNRVDL